MYAKFNSMEEATVEMGRMQSWYDSHPTEGPKMIAAISPAPDDGRPTLTLPDGYEAGSGEVVESVQPPITPDLL